MSLTDEDRENMEAAANAAALGQSGFEEVRTNRSQETHLQKLMQILGL